MLSEDKIQSIQMDHLSHKRIFIGEMDISSHHHHGHHGLDSATLLVKEQTKNRLATYHICEAYDVSAVKQFEDDHKAPGQQSNPFSK